MSQIEITSEQDHGKGWLFLVQVLDDGGVLRKHTLTLSWADYNLWSPDGSDEPARVAEAVMRFLLSRVSPAELAERFDAALVRRMYADADAAIPGLI